MEAITIAAAGDAALVVQLPGRVDPAINGRLVALGTILRRRYAASVIDAVVGYHTLTVYFDPLRVDPEWLEGEIRGVAGDETGDAVLDGAQIDIPVCYGGDLGPDLADVAARIGASEEDVIRLHTSRESRVSVVGFVPGFPYMGTVDDRLALPRRSIPRTKVPAGSVAIAAGQTGIYPIETPGGWHLLGRTPVKPFDATRAEPSLCRPGDRVRFVAIDRAEFDRLA